MTKQRAHVSLLRAAGFALGAAALLTTGWQVFKKPDPDVERGNKLVRKGKPAQALEAYEKAEKRLGRRHRLDYNRGLALFGKGEFKKAKEAFVSASGSTDDRLRAKAFYNLANTLFRLAQPTLKTAQSAEGKVKAFLAQLAQLEGEDKKQQRCQLMQQAPKLFKEAATANQGVVAAFKEARNEYRLVLIRDPKHFDAKWNLELSLRHVTGAEAASAKLLAKAKELAERFEKECKPPEDKKKKKQNQDKQNQDKQNQDKQNQDKQKQQDKQNQDKQKQQDKQNQDKQNQDKQKQQDKQNQQQKPPDDPQQKKMSKEDIAKRKAADKLDSLERKQRRRDRQRDRSNTTRRPIKDW